MKKYITYFTVVISLAACIPPGKLSESLDANSKLSSKCDSLNNKLKDTLTTFSNSLSSYYFKSNTRPQIINNNCFKNLINKQNEQR
jgi:hypothetical protein